MGIFKAIWQILKTAVLEFIDDDAMSHAAAVAFYTALSFAPLLVIVVFVAGFVGPGTQEQLVGQFESLIGPNAGKAVDLVIGYAHDEPDMSSVAGLVGIGVLLFSASAVFAQLQYAMNMIWDVQASPSNWLWGWLRKRMLSLGMVFAIIFMLMVSLTISTGLAMVLSSQSDAWFWQVVNAVVSLLVFALLFAVMFKFLPDVRMPWTDISFGAGMTAVLFVLGKYVIGLYLGKTGVGSAYGAAGSVIVLLVWVYYSCLILFFGAELTQAFALWRGDRIEPERHAIRPHPAGEKKHVPPPEPSECS